MRLSERHGIYLSGPTLLLEENYHGDTPSLLLSNILGLLLPHDVASDKALSRTGSRGTVKLPSEIVEAAHGKFLWVRQVQALSAHSGV